MVIGRGTLYAHVFENLSAGIQRKLFWNLTVNLRQGHEDVDDQILSIHCEWMTLPARSWRGLDGLLLSDCSQPDLIECTYYQNSEHHWANLNSISFRCAKQIGELGVTLSLHTLSETNSDEPAITMTVECEVIFEGIIVVPGNLSPSPVTPQEAAKTAAAFADLERFREPIWDRFRYVFGPIS